MTQNLSKLLRAGFFIKPDSLVVFWPKRRLNSKFVCREFRSVVFYPALYNIQAHNIIILYNKLSIQTYRLPFCKAFSDQGIIIITDISAKTS